MDKNLPKLIYNETKSSYDDQLKSENKDSFIADSLLLIVYI